MKCDRCTKDAIFFRPYSGERLCIKHFLKSVEEKVFAELRKYIKSGMKVGLAVSGGKDSLTLAYITSKFLQKRRIRDVEVKAIIIDEGIKNFRDKAVKIAQQQLSEWNVEYTMFRFAEEYTITIDQIREKVGSRMTCTYCGIFRRRAFETLSKKLKLDLILTGHNADDISQTILLNIIQGNLKHLARTEEFPRTIPKKKPLRKVLEREIALYAVLRGIRFYPYPCPYSKEALRNEIRNFLFSLEEKHPGITYSILHIGEKIKEKIYYQIEVKKCKKCGFPTTRDVCKFCELMSSLGRI